MSFETFKTIGHEGEDGTITTLYTFCNTCGFKNLEGKGLEGEELPNEPSDEQGNITCSFCGAVQTTFQEDLASYEGSVNALKVSLVESFMDKELIPFCDKHGYTFNYIEFTGGVTLWFLLNDAYSTPPGEDYERMVDRIDEIAEIVGDDLLKGYTYDPRNK